MSATLIARKDLEDVVRSKMLWSILGLFIVLMVIITVGAGAGEMSDGGAESVISLFVNIGAALMLPVTAIFVGYLAITGERESGSLRILFGLGHTRREILVGKLVSRITAMVVVTLVSCGIAAAMALAVFGSVPGSLFAGFVGLTVLFALMLTAFAVGISAMCATRYRAMGGAIGGYLVFVMFWYPAVAGVHYLVEGARPGYELPEWYLLLQYLNPMEAYRQAIMLLTGENTYILIGWSNIVEDVGPEVASQPGSLVATNRIAGDLPVYLSEWAAIVVLLVWIIIPVAVGHWQFQRADLN